MIFYDYFSQIPELNHENFRSRKRTRNPQNHKEAKRKKLVQRGDEHVSKSGSVFKQKVFTAQEKCKCKRNCIKNIDVVRQEEIFGEYYQFENWSKKQLFLRSLVKSVEPKRKIVPIIPLKKQTVTHSYFLNDSDGKTHQVCLEFLTNCLQIHKSKMIRAANSIISNPNADEKRGGYRNKDASIVDIAFLKSFISKFPCYESHYRPSKSTSTAKYLNPSLNIIKMYRGYFSLCRTKKKKALSAWMFRHIFNTQFNLRFARLKVDTCNTCDKLNTLLKCSNANEHDKWQTEKEEHLNLVHKYKMLFDKTIENAKNDEENTEVLTFDLQRALEMPRLTTNVAFYKRQLWLYNLCIYDEKRRIGYMYVWPESTASRGAQEIGACLIRHFRKTLPPNTKRLILNSDSCYGQNRNIKLAMMLKQFIDSWAYPDLNSFEQRYFIVGHSYNSCDRCFGLIEREAKITENVFTPPHWMTIMRKAKLSNPKFVVTKMRKEDFVSSKPLENLIVNRKKSTIGNKISWNRFQNIMYERENPFILNIKEFSENEAPTIEISLQKRGSLTQLRDVSLPLLYPNGRPIDKKKYDDLKELMKFVPKKHRSFFKSLKFVEEIE